MSLPPLRPNYAVQLLSAGISIAPESQPFTPVREASPQQVLSSDVEEIDQLSDDPEPVSRLSRSRTLSRRSARLQARQAIAEEIRPAVVRVSTPETIPTPPSSVDRSPPDAERESHATSPKRTPNFTNKEITKPSEQRRLHPFFAATAAAMSNAKERKRTRIVPTPIDAWRFSGATVHINAPVGGLPWEARKGRMGLSQRVEGVKPVSFSAYTGEHDCDAKAVEDVPCESSDIWAERYKRDRRIDVINGAATKELVDWLRDWYETREQTDVSDDSLDSYMMPNDPCDRERVAIITGPVGCGKSTVVSNAARQLGLSILEINASVCRTGRRIREIIGEALSTHRVTQPSMFQSFKPKIEHSGKTLILFEEVDELQDDERGFWSTIQKLAASDDCRRPIVCTANSFTSQMRQFFIQSRATSEEDLERLFINSRIEQLVNPIEYKLIEFQSRSERQASAVINRVCGSENAHAVNDVASCLALTCRDDTRKAINLLHFWGANGLVHETISSPRRTRGSPPKRARHGRLTPETQERIGTTLVNSADAGSEACSTFHVGSWNYCNSKAKNRSPPSSLTKDGGIDPALDAWCTTLEAMSYADTIDNCVQRETSRRSFEISDDPYSICMHSDIYQASLTAKEIYEQSLKCSASFLTFTGGSQHVSELAKEARKDQDILRIRMSEILPLPRRPISLEYLPVLRMMALADEKINSRPSSSGDCLNRPVRRTRARTRHGGFCSLDLDPVTILALRKTALETTQN